MLRLADEPRRRAALDDPAVAHHDDVVDHAGHEGEVVADEDQRRAVLDDELGEQVHDLGLHGDVEGGRRFVGDQQRRPAGEGHGDADPLALAAGELVRVGAHDAVRVGKADPHAQLLGRDGGGAPADTSMQTQRLGDLPPDAHHRVERRPWVLEDHRDAVAAQLGVPAVGPAEQLVAVEADAAR